MLPEPPLPLTGREDVVGTGVAAAVVVGTAGVVVKSFGKSEGGGGINDYWYHQTHCENSIIPSAEIPAILLVVDVYGG